MPKIIKFDDYPEFRPNLTPEQVIKFGSFGGTYYREIKSSITNKEYKDRHKKYFSESFLKKYKPEKYLTKSFDKYDKTVNKYNVKCGQTLEQWEKNKWIKEHDPYGWFEWYCNFHKGRRIKGEDERQIKRWLNFAGPKGRFKKRLINMIKNKNAKFNDITISPVIRQSLQHWGCQITNKDIKDKK